MPVHTSVPIQVFDQDAFHAVERIVTGLSFDIHNQLGRFLDEHLYQTELAARLSAKGMYVAREMRIEVTLQSFQRDYFADFLVDNGVIIETKTADTLTSSHRAQTLNYLYLCGLHHGALLHFRPERVQREFVSTTLTTEERRQVDWDLSNWKPLTKDCEILLATLQQALPDWGARLDPSLYRDAITHFLGGPSEVIREVEVRSGFGLLGKQRVHLIAPDVAFSVTSAVHHPDVVGDHQRRFLQHTTLRALQWINLAGQTATLTTIQA